MRAALAGPALLLLVLLHNVHGFDVVVNCTVRPQIPNPTVQSLQQANKDAYNMLQNGGLNGVANQLLGGDNTKRLSDLYTKNAKKTQGDGGYTKVDSSTKLEIIH